MTVPIGSGHGLTNLEEVSGSENDDFDDEATDPLVADTDGDGLDDGEETSGSENDAFGNAPTDPNAADTDSASMVLPVPGSPRTSSGRSSANAQFTAASRPGDVR